MGRNLILTLFAVTLLAIGLAPGTVRAQSQNLCTASQAGPLETVAPDAWKCAPRKPDLDAPRNVVRLDVAEGSKPRFVISRAAIFSSISIGVVSGDHITWKSADFGEVEATLFDRQFFIPLPEYDGQPDAVLVAVNRVTQAATIEQLRLEAELPGSSRADIAMLLVVALLTGMMLMPILFDVVFYRMLRRKFILWHIALVACIAGQLIINFGLYTAFVSVTLAVAQRLAIGWFALMLVASAMFSLHFIERACVPRWVRQAIVGLTATFAALAVVRMIGIEAFGPWPTTIQYLLGAPLCAAFGALLVAAIIRGSRMAVFLLVGLSPLLIAGTARVISILIPGFPSLDTNEVLLVATILEVSATSLGVAGRFLSIKHDRDRAQGELHVLEGEAQRDSLTGLLNRRVIDSRYEELRGQGFDTFALIDLDKFKSINDDYGHQVGDNVLVACAQAIRCEGDRDVIAIRLGGEEFVLLLRGENSTERAEKLRQSIPRRIAAEVPGLDRLVTASMGVLELPRDALGLMEFEEIYARADKLLYEAKSSGRNRMLYERLQLFSRAKRPSMRNKQAAA